MDYLLDIIFSLFFRFLVIVVVVVLISFCIFAIYVGISHFIFQQIFKLMVLIAQQNAFKLK